MKRISISQGWTSSCGAALAVLLLAGPLPASAAQSPSEVVTGTSESVIAVLKQAGLSKAEKRTKIEDIVLKSVDFDTLAKLTMARNWARLTPAQQTEFQQEFRRHVWRPNRVWRHHRT